MKNHGKHHQNGLNMIESNVFGAVGHREELQRSIDAPIFPHFDQKPMQNWSASAWRAVKELLCPS